jgi:outer membrane protein TolC
MIGRLIRTVVALYLVASLAAGIPAFAQNPTLPPQQKGASQTPAAPAATQTPETPYTSTLFSRDYSKGKRSFPNIFAPYTGINVPMPDLTNSPSIYSFIHDGKLELSLQDAIGLALRNDLNIAVEEYIPWIDETNLLAAKGGGTLPSAQITQLGQVGGGTFDPVISESTSITDQSQTVLNPLSSGVSTTAGNITQTTHTTQVDLSYEQEFHSGTLLGVQLANTRESTSPSQDIFNPSVESTIAATIQQPLLNGWGFLPHTQFILEGENQDKIGVLQFEETAIQEVTNVETTYWNLVAYVQAVDAEKEGLAAFQTLYGQDQHMLQIGTSTPSEVVYAQAQVVETQQTLLQYQAAERVQAAALLQYITKNPADPRLKGLEIVPTTLPEDNPQHSNLSLEDAIKEAWADRPELKVDELTANNDDIIARVTKNALLPTLDVTGTYESTGLSGNAAGAFTPNGTFAADTAEPVVTQNGAPLVANGMPAYIGVANGTTGPTIPGGIHNVYSQIFQNTSPTYEGSLTFSVPLRNRVAQASAAQAKLNNREEIALRQAHRNSIYSAVDEDLTQVDIYADEVASAVKATQLLQQSYQYEEEKFNLAQSSTLNVVIYEQQVVAGQLNEAFAKDNYEIARANLDMALGRTLNVNNITIASNGKDDPLMDVGGNAPLIPGTIGKRLAGDDIFDLGLRQ